METRKHCTQALKIAGKRRTVAARFPRGKQLKFAVHCIGIDYWLFIPSQYRIGTKQLCNLI